MPAISAAYSRLFVSMFFFSILCSVIFTVFFLNDNINYINTADTVAQYTIKHTRLPVQSHSSNNTVNNTHNVLNSRGTNVELGFARKVFESADSALLNDMRALNITNIFPLYKRSDAAAQHKYVDTTPLVLQDTLLLSEFTDTYLSTYDVTNVNSSTRLIVIDKYTKLDATASDNSTHYGSKLSVYTRSDIHKLFDVHDTLDNEAVHTMQTVNPFNSLYNALLGIDSGAQNSVAQHNVIGGDWQLVNSDTLDYTIQRTQATKNNHWISSVYSMHSGNSLYSDSVMRVYHYLPQDNNAVTRDNQLISVDIQLHTNNKVTAIDIYEFSDTQLRITYALQGDAALFRAFDVQYNSASNTLEYATVDATLQHELYTPYTETLLLQSYKLPSHTIAPNNTTDTQINKTEPVQQRIAALERTLLPQSNHAHYAAALYHGDANGYYSSQQLTSFVRKLNARSAHIASALQYHKQYTYYTQSLLHDKHSTISATSQNMLYTAVCQLPYITLIDSNLMLQPIEIIHLDRQTRFTQLAINNNGDILAILDNKPSIILLQRQQVYIDDASANASQPVYLSDNKWNVIHEIELPHELQHYAVLSIDLVDSTVDVPVIQYADIDDILLSEATVHYQPITITHLYILLENGILATYNLNTAELLQNTAASIHDSYENYTDMEYILLIALPQLFVDMSLHYELLAFVAGMCTMLFFALPTMPFWQSNIQRTVPVLPNPATSPAAAPMPAVPVPAASGSVPSTQANGAVPNSETAGSTIDSSVTSPINRSGAVSSDAAVPAVELSSDAVSSAASHAIVSTGAASEADNSTGLRHRYGVLPNPATGI